MNCVSYIALSRKINVNYELVMKKERSGSGPFCGAVATLVWMVIGGP
jgi:hypothetical protein